MASSVWGSPRMPATTTRALRMASDEMANLAEFFHFLTTGSERLWKHWSASPVSPVMATPERPVSFSSRPIAAVLTGLVLGCGVGSGQAPNIGPVADAYFAAWTDRNPEFATFQDLPGARHGALSDNSPEALHQWQLQEDAWLRQLRGVDPASLASADDRVTYAYLRDALERSVQLRVCRRELWNLNHISGWQTDLPVVASAQPVGTVELRMAALNRLRALPRYLAQHESNLREGLRQGLAAPAVVVERVRRQVEALAAQGADQSPFLSPIRRDSTPGFVEAMSAAYHEEVVPALRAHAAFLGDEYLPRARPEDGIANLPEGRACYRALVRESTTLDADPDSLFAVGERVLAELTHARDSLASALGFPNAAAAIQAASARPENRFASREDIVAYAQSLADRAAAAAPAWFRLTPETPLVVQPIPAFQESSAPGGSYYPGRADGSRPGTYLINTGNPTGRSRVGLETLTWHEAVPGHHFQLALATERTQAHPVTRFIFNSGFAEGWALYAEQLADEMGLFSTPEQRIAMYNSLRFRAARLVVDPGLHARGWTRQQALEFMGRTLDTDPQNFAVEVDRYMAWPGQATSYLTGMLVIRELRDRASAELGPRMDVRGFHDRVLEDGSIPLPFLRAKITEWIRERSASASSPVDGEGS